MAAAQDQQLSGAHPWFNGESKTALMVRAANPAQTAVPALGC
jgi:hypothetical protein